MFQRPSWAHQKLRGADNAMAISSYTYQPLQGEGSTRVLLLEPASEHSAPLVASLQHVLISQDNGASKEIHYPGDVPQSNRFPYEAISYAWGEEPTSAALEVYGNSEPAFIAIKPNVDMMLRYLRSTSRQRCLWIDALCINQSDLKEKSAQVKFMGEIYRQAKGVVIWLGPPSSSRPGFDRFFADLVAYAESNDSREREATAKMLRVVLERTWFQRRWIIQEVVFAKQATILCGRFSIDFMVFAKNAWLIAQRHPFFKAIFSGILRKLWIMYKLRLTLGSEAQTDVLSLLVEFAPAECSNEHDRIYALNGLSAVKAPVSYTDPVEDVFIRYADLHIKRGNLAIINCGGAFRSSDSSVPSWVPDWRNLPGYTPLVTEVVPQKYDNVKLRDMAAPEVHLLDSKVALRINGVKLGTVSRIGDGSNNPTWGGDLLPLLQEWYGVFDHGVRKASRRPGSREGIAELFISTMSLGTVTKRTNALSPDQPWRYDPHAEHSPGLTSILAQLIREERDLNSDAAWTNKDEADLQAKASRVSEGLKAVFQDLAYGPSPLQFDLRSDTTSVFSSGDQTPTSESSQGRNVQAREFIEILCRTVAGRTCFWTNEGSFGLGPANMEPGDLIVAIPTCPTPYVLRPKGGKPLASLLRGLSVSSEGSAVKRSGLIGDCYVHDFDSEEIFLGKTDIRTFNIV
ncbi:heterokaryon incompatibility protein-domain-containing protein [Paraphoma chrysanthemicola]|nr:heterokaryon incompatibility protein-domain-containing protein [Paraphoma chrysanthemicola]